MIIAFFLGVSAGALGIVAGFIFLAERTRRAPLPPVPVDVHPELRQPALRPNEWYAPPGGYVRFAEPSRAAQLARLAKLDCALAYAFGDEPFFGGKLFRKETSR